MKLKKSSASLYLFFLTLFVVSAFTLLSLRGNRFDVLAFFFGVVFSVYLILQFNLLNRSFRNFDRFSLLTAQLLVAVGLVVIFRINSNQAMRQFLYFLVSTVFMILTIFIIMRVNLLNNRIIYFFMVLTILLLLSTLVLGRNVYGAKNWISFGGGLISVQPSEFAKVLFIIVSSYYLSTKDTVKSFLPYVIYAALCVIIQVAANDLGSALLLALTFLIMFYSATGRKLLTLLGLGVGATGAVASYFVFSHVKTRVLVWLDPWSHYQTSGYQIVQGLIALASGGLFGTGLSNGSPKSIPAASTDYIFTVIGEEFGIIFAILLIAFYLVFIIRGMLIAIDTDSSFDALLVFGCTAMLALQCFIIIGGVIKLIPLTGITLPFISYGGSSLMSSMIMLGIIEGVAIKTNRREEKEILETGGEIL